MHVLLIKFLEPVRMKQEPLRAFLPAHFPHARARRLEKRDLVGVNRLVDFWNQAPRARAVSTVLSSKWACNKSSPVHEAKRNPF